MSARNSVVSLSSNGSSRVETKLAESPSRALSMTSRTSLGQEGAMLPSSSSKDDDLLSTSSDEVENMAMRTLDNLEENKSVMSARSDGDTDAEEASEDEIAKAKEKNKDLEKQEEKANIQNEFGVCGWILTILSYLLIFITLPISACMCIKVVQEYERAVIFRLGRLMPGGAKGPGIFLIVPCIDTYRKVDLRVLSFEVPPQEILSKDSVTVAVDAVVYFRISNATISVTNVEDAARSTKLLAQTTLRNILGTKTLAEMLSDREAISHQMQTTLDEATEPWGVKVERVEVKDVRLPVQLQRAMAAEAEAAREARAKVIVAEGEQKASRALKEAAEVIAQSPSAIQLRYLQTLNSISAEKNSTIIFPFPIDLLSAFLQKPAPKVEEPPPLPKRLRSCCLYKYPDWVQGMVGEGRPPTSSQGHHQSHHSHQAGGFGPNTTTTSGRPPQAQPHHSHREAPSAAGPMDYRTPPSQLDPSSLYDASRRRTRPPASGANSLLKQAIANRLKPGATDKTPDGKPDDMERSVVSHPSWFRDDEGRTGFRPDGEPDPEKSVKELPVDEDAGGPEITAIDKDLLEKEERRRKRRERKAAQAALDEAMETLEEVAKDPKDMTKEELKIWKEKQKEEKKKEEQEKKEAKKREKELEKEEKERQKEEKKAQKEKEKEEKKLKKQKSTESDVESAKSDKEDEKVKDKKKRRKKDDLTEDEQSEKSEITEKKKHHRSKQPDGQKSSESEVIKPKKLHTSSDKKQRSRKAELGSPNGSTSSAASTPSKETGLSVRRNSNDSASSTASSRITVKESPLTGKPPRPSGRNKNGRPKKNTIGERRDSSMSESSRNSAFSHKSVTFNDRVQMHEIERRMTSSEEDDTAIMSDDESGEPMDEKRKRLAKILQQRNEDYDDELDEFEEQERLIEEQFKQAAAGYPVYDMDRDSDNSFYPEDVDPDRYLMNEDGSLISLDHLPASVRKAIVAEARMRDMDVAGMGSMSKLHDEGSRQASLLSYPTLPRSASGYFDDPRGMQQSYQQALYPGTQTLQPGSQNQPGSTNTLEDQRRMEQSYYDNVQGPLGSKPSSLTGVPPPSVLLTPTRRSSADIPAPSTKSETSVPSPPRKISNTSIDKTTVSSSLAKPDSKKAEKKTDAQKGSTQKVTVTTSTTETTMTNRTEVVEKEEAEMRRKFVERFGANRKAPIATEEDPTDPVQTLGSQESVSGGSRESVVSAASIKTESNIRRGFNY